MVKGKENTARREAVGEGREEVKARWWDDLLRAVEYMIVDGEQELVGAEREEQVKKVILGKWTVEDEEEEENSVRFHVR